ncbi:hypothetical protein GCM10007147_05380 [Nocardiopsis kunsanensis]|uniref:Uncharacterized protein n=2 Tax=Nocardiopsis kunsanensis TaxID=141693 RepID=A0A918X7Y9_9ACTN|nr:hypothetical protein GCM10007147_05380 [Nocardiopsis kunsanensis]
MTATDPDTEQWARLQKKYEGKYRVVRTPHMWRAHRLVHDDREPVVTADTAEELEKGMEHPQRRIGWWDPL